MNDSVVQINKYHLIMPRLSVEEKERRKKERESKRALEKEKKALEKINKKRKVEPEQKVDPVEVARKGKHLSNGKWSDVDKLPQGSFLSYYGVLKLGSKYSFDDKYDVEQLPLTDQDPLIPFTSSTSLLNDRSLNTEFVEEKKVSRTQLIQILDQTKGVVKVKFFKKVKPSEAATNLIDADLSTALKRSNMVKRILTGEERMMIGMLVYSNSEWGRACLVDLEFYDANRDKGAKAAERLVDHRTLTDVITKNVRYWCDPEYK